MKTGNMLVESAKKTYSIALNELFFKDKSYSGNWENNEGSGQDHNCFPVVWRIWRWQALQSFRPKWLKRIHTHPQFYPAQLRKATLVEGGDLRKIYGWNLAPDVFRILQQDGFLRECKMVCAVVGASGNDRSDVDRPRRHPHTRDSLRIF